MTSKKQEKGSQVIHLETMVLVDSGLKCDVKFSPYFFSVTITYRRVNVIRA